MVTKTCRVCERIICNDNGGELREFIKRQRGWYDKALDMVEADNLTSEVVDA